MGSRQGNLGKHLKNMRVQTWGMYLEKINTCNVIGGNLLNCDLTSSAVILEQTSLWLSV